MLKLTLNNKILLFKLVSLRATKGSAAIYFSDDKKRLLRHFVPRNDTKMVFCNRPNLDTSDKKAKVKLKGQVILENAIVFVSLAVIAVSAMYLFAKLNKNIINHIGEFRNSRKQALNSPLNSITAPIAFLNLERGDMGSICPDLGLGADNFDLLHRDDPLMTEAELLGLKSSLIFSKVLPYNINLMRVLAGEIKVEDHSAVPEENCDTIRALVIDAKNLLTQAVDLKSQSIAIFKKILNEPEIPGMYDPNPRDHPGLYELDPVTQEKEIQSLQKQNENNRQNLQDMIEGLDTADSDFLNTLNAFIIPKLNYIHDNIGTVYCQQMCFLTLTSAHNSSVALLNDTFTSAKDGEGIWSRINEPYLSLALRNDLVNLAGQLKDNIVKDDLTSLRALISQMHAGYDFLGEGPSTGGSGAQTINNYLSENQQAHDLIVNNPNPTEEETQKIQDILSNGTKNTFQSAANDNIIKELVNTFDERLQEAVLAWEAWEEIPEDTALNIQKKEIYKRGRDYAIDTCQLYADVIYKLTQPSAVFDYYVEYYKQKRAEEEKKKHEQEYSF